jgi:hypothetical protein
MSYATSTRSVLLVRADRARPDKLRASTAADLEKRIAAIIKDSKTKLLWAHTPIDKPTHYFFPTGKIFVLFDKKTNKAQRREILSKYPHSRIELFKDLRMLPPSDKRAARVTLAEKARKSKGKEAREGKKTVAVPIAKVMLPSGEELRAFEVASDIGRNPEVLAATADAHLISPDDDPPTRLLQWLPYDPASIIGRNFIHRAWELLPSASFQGQPRYIAIFDTNFYDHSDISYEWIGYDAADGDSNPRDPLDPPWLDPSSFPHPLEYVHGTHMAGVIAGQGYGSPGAAPGSIVVPIRDSAMDPDVEFPSQQYFYNLFEHYINALCRLYCLSHEVDLTIANFSIEKEAYFREFFGMTSWYNWVLLEGKWGHQRETGAMAFLHRALPAI